MLRPARVSSSDVRALHESSLIKLAGNLLEEVLRLPMDRLRPSQYDRLEEIAFELGRMSGDLRAQVVEEVPPSMVRPAEVAACLP